MADLGFFKEWVTRFESRTVSLSMALKLFFSSVFTQKCKVLKNE